MYYPNKKESKNDIKEERQRKIEDIDVVTQEQKEKILRWLTKIGASYVAEISFETGISEYVARQVLSVLVREEKVEMIPVDMYVPDIRLADRVADQSAIGQAGYANFSKRHWFGLRKNPGGIL